MKKIVIETVKVTIVCTRVHFEEEPPEEDGPPSLPSSESRIPRLRLIETAA